ncbi:hypothetical protein [Furfurilactobacillus siliginis]|uniref:Uncharacterized protein n=1 Tax=Furfurilactobacillus siliginis TaxID=348151 RepID=A0A0R2L139_9LACO|nr:hypothetical protein [Furfurilactobacillus siliginis]KRN95512.1 hypothetical protein IV55_GL001975 [Furfurilactobacillus siliginis]GEK28691.1 hypothetical protein LSI01_10020 [Furfurilactobacillus siliginis]
MDNEQTQKISQVPMYYADNHGHLRSKLVPQDYICQAYETLETPTNSPYEPVMVANGHVTGATLEEHLAWQKQQPDYVEPAIPEPDATAVLGGQVAVLTSKVTNLTQVNAQLGAQLATALAGKKEEKTNA